MILVLGVSTFLRALLGRSTAVTFENIALRHQLMVLQRSIPRPRLRRQDRIFWLCLSRLWVNWRSSLLIVQPSTVIAWHRQGFRLYWRWKSRLGSPGRPPIDLEIRTLIRRMARDNPTWGRRRIQAELRFLGYEVAALTVAKYMPRASHHPSPTWRAFLAAHRHDIAAIDFFVVPTLTFRLLFGFVVLRHDRRELIHIGVTDQPIPTASPSRVSFSTGTTVSCRCGTCSASTSAARNPTTTTSNPCPSAMPVPTPRVCGSP